MIDERRARHAEVALRIVRRHAALVAEANHDAAPVEALQLGEARIDRLRRRAAGERDRKPPALGDRLGRFAGDGVRSAGDERVEVGVDDHLGDGAVAGGDSEGFFHGAHLPSARRSLTSDR